MRTAERMLPVFVVLFAAIVRGQDASFIVLGDLHYDKMTFHNLEWLKGWQGGDDYRQVTKEYTVFTRNNFVPLMEAVRGQMKTDGNLKAIVQLGDIMEGLAGDREHAMVMAKETTSAIQEANLPAPWILVKGNHDGWYGFGEPEIYRQIMVPFRNRQIGIDEKNLSFTYRVGDVEFFCPDSNNPLEVSRFLSERLTQSDAKYKFVAMHVPVLPITGRCWDIFDLPQDQNDTRVHSVCRQVLELLAKEKAVVLCAHLHRYSVLKYQAASGPVVQITLNSVVRDRSRTEPYWKETEYGPGLVDLEPEYAPNDAARRRHILSNKAKNMKEFRVADLPGYGILKIKGGQITIDIYANATKTLHETVNISQMLEN